MKDEASTNSSGAPGVGRLRPDCRLMHPDEMRPEERWDEILDLFALMALPKTSKVPPPSDEF